MSCFMEAHALQTVLIYFSYGVHLGLFRCFCVVVRKCGEDFVFEVCCF